MKILLVGEYSRLHNSLKEGLVSLGHEVTLVGCGDHFKKFPVDQSIYATFCNDFLVSNFICRGLKKVFKIDVEKIEKAVRFYFLLPNLKDYDHVQLINSDAIETYPILSLFLFKKLFKHIKSRSLLVCGDETPIIDYLLKEELRYSVLTPYIKDNTLLKEFQFSLKYKETNYRKTFNWLSQNCQNSIVSDIDYKIPMEKMGFTIHFIPNPINTDKISFQNLKVENPIVIFLGINRGSYIKKGIPFFEKALQIIKAKYVDQIEIIISENLPYQAYLEKYAKAHILLDQVYAYDQGYNALESMAAGKIVFTGAETEFLQHYHLTEDDVCINALNDATKIAEKLAFLIENPEKRAQISGNARNFIIKEHHYKTIAAKYVNVWEGSFFHG
jgi:glycosyltransferase involved in cell wall biosynthesis